VGMYEVRTRANAIESINLTPIEKTSAQEPKLVFLYGLPF